MEPGRKPILRVPDTPIRQDFFLGRTFRNLDDLNAQFDAWRTEIANPRIHATTDRVVDEAFVEEKPTLKPLVVSRKWRKLSDSVLRAV